MGQDLKGKTAFVSGGTRGIGLAIAKRLSKQGANVVINYFRSRQSADEALADIKENGTECYAHRANMGNMDQIVPIFDKIKEKFGKLDILVSNAAIGHYGTLLDIKDKNWNISMETNAHAFLKCIQLAEPMMPDKSRIVSLSSLGSIRYIPGYASIGVSKSAIENITRYAAVEFASRGITVNCVSGGFIATDALKVFPNYKEMIAEVTARTPMGRVGTVEEMAAVVLFLISNEASWLTGQTIIVDGGYSLP